MPSDDGLLLGEDGRLRCWWPAHHADYLAYHDEEWGRPVDDDHRLFEKICLEGFQSGLSWLTILRKRARFREVFEGFDFERVARFGSEEVELLLGDAGIIRHRQKIESVINNARRARKMAEAHGSLGSWFWQWEPPDAERPKRFDKATLHALGKTPSSERMSKALKKLGWSFVGPTTAYAFMQAMGLVNDHLDGCHVREAVEAERQAFTRPSATRTIASHEGTAS
ncbi:MAG: DNA-3-methyladenine glycosylase I [Myxococcota bacterium]